MSMLASSANEHVPLGGPASVVETACPLDCPDACSLAVTVQHGKVIKIDGSHKNPVTGGFICAKVRKFGDRVYGADRLLYPAIRKGRKGEGKFERVIVGRRARARRRTHASARKPTSGGESILPYSYGGSNGLLTQDNLDATLWRRFGTSRLARTLCAAPTGAANMALYGKMPSVTYQDYPEARADRPVGRESVGVRHPSRPLRPRGAEARREARSSSIRARRRLRDRPTCTCRSGPAPTSPSRWRSIGYLFEQRVRRRRRSSRAHARRRPAARAGRAEWTIEKAAEVAGIDAAALEQRRRAVRDELAGAHPLRLGPRAQPQRRQRRDGGAGAAGGRRQVRRPRRRLFDEQLRVVEHRAAVDRRARAVDAHRQHEPSWPGADRVPRPAGRCAVRLQLQPGGDGARSAPRACAGSSAEDLFTVVFEQVMTDTALYADVVLPATTFLEGYDFAQARTARSTSSSASPVIDAVGESRSNADVFGELCARLGVLDEDEPTGELDLLVRVLDRPARHDRRRPARGHAARAAVRRWRPFNSWTCSRTRRTGRSICFRRRSKRARRRGSTASSRIRRPTAIR